MKELVVAAVQMKSSIGNARENATRICKWMSEAAREGAQLVFFPECCLTGYGIAQAEEVAVAADEDSIAQVEKCSAELGVTIGYGFIERVASEGGASRFDDSLSVASPAKPYNTYVVAGSGGRLAYRKTHLGLQEQQAFAAGDELPVVSVAGVKIGVQLCWEAHIPDITTTLRAKGAELVLMPHAVGVGGSRRTELWSRYLPARAYDNGLFVVACNALRQDGEGVAGGGVAAYGPDGSCQAMCEGGEEEMLLVRVGGVLPRENPDAGMRGASYFDRRRPELYLVQRHR